MLKPLRQQVQQAFLCVPAARRPALRRSDAADALLATDLPLIAEPEAVRDFCTALSGMGWQSSLRNGWLILDAPVPAPDAAPPRVLRGACGCCISLLQRHPDDADSRPFIRRVVKAADAGPLPFERLCRQLHAEFAAMLRLHQPLPGGLLPYICQAAIDLYGKEPEP